MRFQPQNVVVVPCKYVLQSVVAKAKLCVLRSHVQIALQYGLLVRVFPVLIFALINAEAGLVAEAAFLSENITYA